MPVKKKAPPKKKPTVIKDEYYLILTTENHSLTPDETYGRFESFPTLADALENLQDIPEDLGENQVEIHKAEFRLVKVQVMDYDLIPMQPARIVLKE